MAKLKNKRHELFCQEYLVDLNGAQAYLRVGYKTSPEIAARNASRLLINVDIQNRISELMGEREKRTEITSDRVLKELAHIAFDDIGNYLSFKTNTEKQIEVDIKDSTTIDTRNIAEISIGKDGQFKFKLYCKDNALIQLGKHLGMFKDRQEIGVIEDDRFIEALESKAASVDWDEEVPTEENADG